MYYLHLPQDNQVENQVQATANDVEQLTADESADVELKDLSTTAVEAGRFNTLIQAVKSAGLEQTLSGPGPLTVFAPTDEAFSKLPESIFKALTEDSQALSDLLTAHIVPGRVSAAEVANLESARSVQGCKLNISEAEGVHINGAKVISTDIEASNGIIHVIDSVIFPQS